MREILKKMLLGSDSPYAATFKVIRQFDTRVYLVVGPEDHKELPLEKAVELIASRLPAQMDVRHGDKYSLAIFTPAKLASQRGAVVIIIETPISPKTVSVNSGVAHMLAMLAESVVLDRNLLESGHPNPSEMRN